MAAQRDTCPFLVPVVGDQLWLYAVPAYCRRPDDRLRVPASASLMHFCMRDYAACEGYRAATVPAQDLGD